MDVLVNHTWRRLWHGGPTNTPTLLLHRPWSTLARLELGSSSTTSHICSLMTPQWMWEPLLSCLLHGVRVSLLLTHGSHPPLWWSSLLLSSSCRLGGGGLAWLQEALLLLELPVNPRLLQVSPQKQLSELWTHVAQVALLPHLQRSLLLQRSHLLLL